MRTVHPVNQTATDISLFFSAAFRTTLDKMVAASIFWYQALNREEKAIKTRKPIMRAAKMLLIRGSTLAFSLYLNPMNNMQSVTIRRMIINPFSSCFMIFPPLKICLDIGQHDRGDDE